MSPPMPVPGGHTEMCSWGHMAFLNTDLDPGVVHLKSFAKYVSPTHFIGGEHSLTCCWKLQGTGPHNMNSVYSSLVPLK